MSDSTGVPMLADAPVLRRIPPIGPHPLRIAWWAGFTQVRKVRRRFLRATYDRRVAALDRSAEIRPPVVAIPRFEELPPKLRSDASRIRSEADAILAHRVRYLGSGDVELGAEIDWHRDFKSGYVWPRTFYMDLQVTRLDDDSDAKVPWELSRGHQLLTLARAWRLFDDPRYLQEIEAELASWIEANPPGVGINWVNAMEVGLRAVNWVWTLAILEGPEGGRPLDPGLRERLSRVLLAHGRHIAANLEGSPFLRSNHYLSDLLGLLAIGACLPDDAHARRWERFARRRLEHEITTQVFDDGVDFEASLPYHGLVLEIFLLSLVLAEHEERPFSPRYLERIERMLEVSRAVRHADGRTPVFGDNDSGRVLPGGFDRPPTHDHLLWLGSVVAATGRPIVGDADPEVAWTLGVDAWTRANALVGRAEPGCAAFQEGGIYVLAGGDTKVVARCGEVGQNGSGGHAHNDLLSYELSHAGVTAIVDSGTYAYTFDLAARNELRATAAHNTVMVDGEEINPLPDGLAFKLAQAATPAVLRWEPRPEACTLVAEHDGYRRLDEPVVHRRAFELTAATGAVEISDELIGAGGHLAESFIHLRPGAEVAPDQNGVTIVIDGLSLRLTAEGFDGPPRIIEGWVADRYGARERGPVLSFRRTGSLPARVTVRIAPGPDRTP